MEDHKWAFNNIIKFLHGFFKLNCSHHVNQASVNSKFLEERVIIPIPPLNEQNRIVNKLDNLFTSIDTAVNSLKQT